MNKKKLIDYTQWVIEMTRVMYKKNTAKKIAELYLENNENPLIENDPAWESSNETKFKNEEKIPEPQSQTGSFTIFYKIV